MKSQISAVRPFLYIQEEGEIVMVKLIGKKWIVIGAKTSAEDGSSKGHITVWERSNQDTTMPVPVQNFNSNNLEQPKQNLFRLKVFQTQVCLDGRFWIRTTSDQ